MNARFKWPQTHDESAPRDSEFTDAELTARLEETWHAEPGLMGWLRSTDHKSIGRRYIVTAFIHLMLAGALAMVMRAQLAYPDMKLLDPDLYNQFFTTHGTVMMFLFAVPMVEGAMIYLVPLMVGTRIIAFPRLNAFSYWVFLFGGVMIWVAFLLNSGPDAGWFSYPPLSGPEYGAGKRSDVFSQLITYTEIAALAVAVEIIVTVLKFRAPGMTLNRMPVFAWASLVTSAMIVLSMPSIVTTSTFLLLDRLVGTHFFNPAEGGDVLLWQHLFWYFAHPEVYIIFLPALGLASHIVETFSRRPMFGYTAVVLAILSQGILSFGLWVHHMFATNLPRLGNAFFAASSMAIAVPSGVVLFCWLATIATGRVRLAVPMLWIGSFFVLFLVGGLSGVMLASVPIDLQVTDTYVLPGHIHYVLLGGAVCPLIGAAVMWYPKLTGVELEERMALLQWALFLAGSFIAFGAMLLLGISGMTRRVYTYPHIMGWDQLNLIASIGAWAIGLSFAIFVANIYYSHARRRTCRANPHGASTLEWLTASPPPPYNFGRIPVVASRTPLWDEPMLEPVRGLRVDEREVLVTSGVHAVPQMREHAPEPTILPLLAAIIASAILAGTIFTPQAVVWGALPFTVVMILWLYPKRVLAPKPGKELAP